MLQKKLSQKKEISKYFKNINWNELNKKNKRNYEKSLEEILENIPKEEKEKIQKEIKKVYEEMKNLEITLTRKKDLEK